MKNISEKYAKAVAHKSDITDSLLTGLIVGAVVGVICVFYFHFNSTEFFISPLFMVIGFALAFAGTPYMWVKLPKVYGLGPVSMILLLVKIIIASLGGFFITPVVLLIKSIQVYRYSAAIKQDRLLHPEKYY